MQKAYREVKSVSKTGIAIRFALIVPLIVVIILAVDFNSRMAEVEDQLVGKFVLQEQYETFKTKVNGIIQSHQADASIHHRSGDFVDISRYERDLLLQLQREMEHLTQ